LLHELGSADATTRSFSNGVVEIEHGSFFVSGNDAHPFGQAENAALLQPPRVSAPGPRPVEGAAVIQVENLTNLGRPSGPVEQPFPHRAL